MKSKTHNTEEIIRILRQADGGKTAQSVCREHNTQRVDILKLKKEIRRYGGAGELTEYIAKPCPCGNSGNIR